MTPDPKSPDAGVGQDDQPTPEQPAPKDSLPISKREAEAEEEAAKLGDFA